MKLEGLLSKGAHVGFLGHYYLYVNPELGVRKVMLQQITCTCAPHKGFIELTWKPDLLEKYQPRFSPNCLCNYWENFKGENNWIPVQTTPKKGVKPLDIKQPQ